jgi:hypothetical protein
MPVLEFNRIMNKLKKTISIESKKIFLVEGLDCFRKVWNISSEFTKVRYMEKYPG